MSDNEYKPGDVVNGHMLGTDGQWHVVDEPAPPMPTSVIKVGGTPGWVKWVALTAIAVVAIIVVGVIAASGGGSSDPPATPTPTPTVPEPAPATSEPPDTGYDYEYQMVMRLLKSAWRETGGGTDMCVVWYVQRDRWTREFTDQAVDSLAVDRDTAQDAVEDFFDDLCATA